LKKLHAVRVGICILLMALCAYLAVQVIIAGIVFGDTVDLPSKATMALEMHRRGQYFFWLMIVLLVITSLILSPVVRPPLSMPSNALSRLLAFAMAFGLSMTGIAIFSVVLIWILRTFH
jgi:hypothetical protein